MNGADEIREFKKLLDEGIISQQEFEIKKKELLGIVNEDELFYEEEYISHTPYNSTQIQQPKKRKGCLLYVLACLGIIVFIGFFSSNTPPPTPMSTMTLKEFDARSWNEFKGLYKSHNNLIEAVNSYSDGNGSGLDLYDYCDSTVEYYQNIWGFFDYGITEDEKAYLSVFESMIINDQMAAETFMKYLDSDSLEDLSNAKEYIKKADESASLVATNRGTLLVKAGYSDEEIEEIINNLEDDLTSE